MCRARSCWESYSSVSLSVAHYDRWPGDTFKNSRTRDTRINAETGDLYPEILEITHREKTLRECRGRVLFLDVKNDESHRDGE